METWAPASRSGTTPPDQCWRTTGPTGTEALRRTASRSARCWTTALTSLRRTLSLWTISPIETRTWASRQSPKQQIAVETPHTRTATRSNVSRSLATLAERSDGLIAASSARAVDRRTSPWPPWRQASASTLSSSTPRVKTRELKGHLGATEAPGIYAYQRD
jgi:hypothetical protein